MDVARVEVIPYALPFRRPYVTARGRLERRELILLRLTGADGAVGLGETTSLSLRGGRALCDIVAELEELGRAIVAGGPIDEAGLSAEARCAHSIAVADLSARIDGRAIGDAGSEVRCNATLSAGEPAAVAEEASHWREFGFDSFKLKVGTGADVDQVRAVRDAVGPDARIRLDANGAWDPATAIATLDRVEHLGIELCEQPTATLEGMAEVRAASAIPIAADESVADRDEARRARELGACDLITLKLAKVGGLEEAADDWQLPVYISSALEGPVGIAAAAAAAQRAARPAHVAHGLATQLLFSEEIAEAGPEIRAGALRLPPGPGLGVEIDEAALDRLRL